ncbi:secreted RxLR effector protein 161-like [Macadamia integrifolia]|uniref:secreted RxLR effector protein 161-like n=1 Tax=Macadamia integrifolia TaxID=60698 RepID=UPI001C4F12F8|nr:secreted RxLR effector protein 161-like [Macadamia integrifolia]
MIENKSQLVVVVYVDDIIFGGHNDEVCRQFAERMTTKFKMSMLGELSYFLGLQVNQQQNGVFISQANYIKEMLKKFMMEDSKPISTPMVVGCKFSSSDESSSVDQTLYRTTIGSLLYLTASRPDILQAVCLVAQFQGSPKETHLVALKKIFRYLRGTMEYSLWYPKIESFTLIAFSDADWAGRVDDRKSTSGGTFFSGQSLVAWHSKKQESISLSIAEAEYIATTASCTQVI